jgi:hypothetical protein
MARKAQRPVRITSATRSHSDDIAARQRRYVISMAIRTVCFLLAVVSIGHWFMWVFLTASFVLPYVAVVMANAASAADPAELTAIDLAGDARQLPDPAGPAESPAESPESPESPADRPDRTG